MTSDRRRVFAALAVAAAAALALAAGCAKDPTSVSVVVDADPSVPPILILRTTVAAAGDPSHQSSAQRSSMNQGDAADRPGPFVFPTALQLTVDSSFAGPVVVTVQGIDWDNYAVIGAGSADAVVEAQKTTEASLKLEPLRGGAGDGGTD
jgi:hypothetical protein